MTPNQRWGPGGEVSKGPYGCASGSLWQSYTMYELICTSSVNMKCEETIGRGSGSDIVSCSFFSRGSTIHVARTEVH